MDKLYKVITKDNKAIFAEFDYTKYLPKGKKKGKWLPIIKDISECERGYHVTNYWNMWLNSKNDRIFEVEVKRLKEKSGYHGVIEKHVCGSFRFVKEIFPNFDDDSNTEDWNTGSWNTGGGNTGDGNTGGRNVGNWNTGDRNVGDRNTGCWNTENWNVGNYNTGGGNVGGGNTGDGNTGGRNVGNYNTGGRNVGSWNTGDRNVGDRNTGCWNISDFNNGFFNTKKIETIKVFNKECRKELWQSCDKPNFINFDLINNDYKKSFIESFNKTTKEDVKRLLKLPNFDYGTFKEISGITKKMINKKLK